MGIVETKMGTMTNDEREIMADLLTTIRVASEMTGQRVGQLISNVSIQLERDSSAPLFYIDEKELKFAIWEYVREHFKRHGS
jgi:hypothetical protein